MPFQIRDASPPPHPDIRRPRPGGPASIVQMQWHATRGATSMDRQVGATESWFASRANTLDRNGDPRGWGGSAEFVVGPDYRADGKIVIVRFGDTYNEFSSWSAGYGAAGTLPAAPYGVAIEVAQPAGKDSRGRYTGDPNANFEHFTDETIEACVWLAGQINRELEALGVEPVPTQRIESWDQRKGEPVPKGHLGHDDLANGVKLGKSDPGHLFPWGELLAGIRVFERSPQPPPEAMDLAKLHELQRRVETEALISFRSARDMLDIARQIDQEIDRLEGR